MNRETVDQVLQLLRSSSAKQLDLTGGAPELNPNFRYLVTAARKLGVHVIDRCNLTILFEPGQEGLAQFLADQQVEVVASLPCYLKENVDQQRGKGVFDSSLAALKLLNTLGYGKTLPLTLMYNPQGPSLPPPQGPLEADFRQRLWDDHGITFSHLHTLTNMPIQRFGSTLISKGEFSNYMQVLRDNYQEQNLNNVMCRSLISIDWQGYLYDCDFNQMLKLPAPVSHKPSSHISDIIGADLRGKPIVVKDHCYGCTAGQGSSCGGAL